MTVPAIIEPAGESALVPAPSRRSEAASAFQRAGKADATKRAYLGDVRQFDAWCVRFGFQSMPATALAVLEFLTHEAGHLQMPR